jgi:oligopeptide transport system permease protein
MEEALDDKFSIVGGQNLYIEEEEVFSTTYWKNTKRKLLNNKVAILAVIILAAILVLIIIGPRIFQYGINVPNFKMKNFKPTLEHPFGTDFIGRDIFVRVCSGAQTTLIIGAVGAILNTVIGAIFGVISGYFGGLIDNIIMRIVEILLCMPTVLLAIVVSMFYRPGALALIIALCVNGWCNSARLVRGQTIQICNQEYIMAAQALGAEPARIITKHLISNVISIIIVSGTLEIPLVMLNEAFLTFIGCGIAEPEISLGLVTKIGYDNLVFYPYQVIIPGLFMTLIILCFNIIGDGLSDALDPSIIL